MRLFIAVNLPEDVRAGLQKAVEPLHRADYPVRWVAPDGLHLTLKFLGEVATERISDVAARTEAAVVGAKPFTLPMEGFGTFPPTGAPRVVWVGCEHLPPLELLQHRMEQEMATLGFEVEGRPFRPHITLGRARRHARAGDFDGFVERLGALDFQAAVDVHAVDVMRSRLSPAGARYEVYHHVELEG